MPVAGEDAASPPAAGSYAAPGIELPKRFPQPALTLTWNEVLSLTPARNQYLLWYRHPRTGIPTCRRIGAADPQLASLRERWRRRQRQNLERHGSLEGCALPADSTPTWLMVAATLSGVGLICTALVGFARTASELWPLIAELPGDASGWYLLTLGAYTAGGVTLTALLLMVLGRHLEERRNARFLATWRIDRRGLSRRDAHSTWVHVGPQPGDRVDSAAFTLGGARFQHSALSGQPLTRELLAALSAEHAAPDGKHSTSRAAALRLALLWPPLLVGCGFLVARILHIDELRGLWPAAAAAVVMPVAIGLLILTFGSRSGRGEDADRGERDDLVGTLR